MNPRIGGTDVYKRQVLEKVLYFAAYIVTDPGDAPLALNQVLTEKEYRDMREKYEDDFKAEMCIRDRNGALLRDLLGALDELLALHGILGRHPAEMRGGKGGDAGVFEFLPRNGDSIADGENAWVKHLSLIHIFLHSLNMMLNIRGVLRPHGGIQGAKIGQTASPQRLRVSPCLLYTSPTSLKTSRRPVSRNHW